jgi:hypothetical protein
MKNNLKNFASECRLRLEASLIPSGNHEESDKIFRYRRVKGWVSEFVDRSVIWPA